MNIIGSSLLNFFQFSEAINPQPLPPRSAENSSRLWNSELNPQPLPPNGIIIVGGKPLTLDDFCGTPHPPPPPTVQSFVE